MTMTDYKLRVSSYAGLVAGARHVTGRVQGPYAPSCHGGTIFHGRTGKTTCAEGHEIPKRVEWTVEAQWTEERHERWADESFEADGPTQFTDERELFKAARARFLGECGERQWWEERIVPGKPGDRLYYAYLPEELVVPEGEREDEYWKDVDARRRAKGLPVAGDLIAEVPQPGASENPEAKDAAPQDA